MAQSYFINPFSQFNDPSSNKPVGQGLLYIGEIDKDPEDFPVTVSVVQPDGTTLEVSQPLSLSVGGNIIYEGNPVQLSIAETRVSTKVVNAGGQVLYYAARWSPAPSVYEMSLTNSSLVIGGVTASQIGMAVRNVPYAILDNFSDLVIDDDWTDALWAAIESMRANSVNILQYIGGPSITAYSSGTVIFGRGEYKIRPDEIEITQDLGLQLIGQGSRRTNKAIKAPTTLLIDGASSGFGIKFFGNGARGGHIQDMDVNYNSNSFTGYVIHAVQVPGFTTERIRIGWHDTPIRSAAACLATAFDEFNSHTDIVFDGAEVPWLSDTTTELSGPSDFGGSNHTLKNPVFYDALTSYMYHAANRTRIGLTIINPSFDVIDREIERAVYLFNVDGFKWMGGGCASSGAVVATVEWITLENVTGSIDSAYFNDLVPVGTISNCRMSITGNRFFCTDGLVFNGGVNDIRANEVAKAENGFTVLDSPGSFTFGVNYFGPLVNYSYNVPSSNIANISIDYDKNQDGSVNKWLIPGDANSVRVRRSGEPRLSFTDASFTHSIYDTGTHYISLGTSAQVVNMPDPVPGTKFKYSHLTAQPLTINGPVIAGESAINNSGVTVTDSANVGQYIEFEAYSDLAWQVTNVVGDWTFNT